jgi:LacI family transcriptional regulator
MTTQKKPTIDDVAALAGVGRTSVSRVLNNGPNVRPQMREKILKAVETLNFKVNQQARSLARGETKKIGIINASDFDKEPNSYYSAAIEIGALRACAARSYSLQTHTINQNSINRIEIIKAILEQNSYSGIILTPPFCDDIKIIKLAQEFDCPIVAISAGQETQKLIANIGIDEELAGFAITSHLIKLGHRKLSFIQGIAQHLAAEQRFHGFIRAIKEANIPENEIIVERGNFTFKSGIENAQKIFESSQRPSAIICANDDMAAGALFCAHRLNLKVPNDISIVGFDDTPVSEIVWPPLTTIHQPLKRFGHEAINTLIDIIENPIEDVQPINRTIDFTIIERQSTQSLK